MSVQTIPSFSIIGISVRTTNENGQATQDIPALLERFISEKILGKIPNKTGNSLYCVYTEYEKDHTKPYTTILGCRVTNLQEIPDGMVGKTFDETVYKRHIAKGNILEGLVYNEWTKIWNSDIDRAYIADFEIYGERAQSQENAEVDIFVSIK